MTDNQEHIDAIIIRNLEGTCTQEELNILSTWLAADDLNQKYYEDVERIHLLAKSAGKTAMIDVDKEWDIFKANLDQTDRKQGFLNPWLRIAASIVVMVSLGYLIWINAFQSDTVTVFAKVNTKTIVLPDSSLVTLNLNSSLTYDREFANEQRNVALAGEAFFEVARDEEKPFIISLPQAEVEVLGTSFNVEAYDDRSETVVIVNSGRVKFKETASNQAVILEKGEKGVLARDFATLSKTENANRNFMAWKTREIVFNNTALAEVVETLNKAYNAKISLNSAVSENCTVTVTFENQSLEAVLAVLEQTLNLEYRKKGNIIEVIKADC